MTLSLKIAAAINTFTLLGLLGGTSAQTTPNQPSNFHFVGKGYDILFGNPHPEFGLDQGWRNDIFKQVFEGGMEFISGENYSIPVGYEANAATSCSFTFEASDVLNANQYREDLSVKVTTAGSYDGLLYDAAFKASTEYKRVEQRSVSERLVFVESTGECDFYDGRVRLGDAPEVADGFYNDLLALPGHPSDALSAEELDDFLDDRTEKYLSFVQRYGTHVATQVRMGGVFGHRYELSKVEKARMEQENFDISFAAELETRRVALDVALDTGHEKELAEQFMQRTERTVSFSFGGQPVHLGTEQDWFESVREDPLPTKHSLTVISDLFHSSIVPGAPDLEAKQMIMEEFLSLYCLILGQLIDCDNFDPPEGFHIASAIEFQEPATPATSPIFRIPFNDFKEWYEEGMPRLTAIKARGDDAVRSLQLVYGGYSAPVHGQSYPAGTLEEQFVLAPGEYINEVTVCGTTQPESMTFKTNLGKSKRFGESISISGKVGVFSDHCDGTFCGDPDLYIRIYKPDADGYHEVHCPEDENSCTLTVDLTDLVYNGDCIDIRVREEDTAADDDLGKIDKLCSGETKSTGTDKTKVTLTVTFSPRPCVTHTFSTPMLFIRGAVEAAALKEVSFAYFADGNDLPDSFAIDVPVSRMTSNFPALLDGNAATYVSFGEADLPQDVVITFDYPTRVSALGMVTDWQDPSGRIQYSTNGATFIDAREYSTTNSYVWRLGAQGESCTETCANHEQVCHFPKLTEPFTAEKVSAAAEEAGTTCAGTAGWGYPHSPGVCTHPECCYGDCVGICAAGTHSEQSCDATSAHYSRLCPCIVEQADNVFELNDLPPIRKLRITIEDSRQFPALIREINVATLPYGSGVCPMLGPNKELVGLSAAASTTEVNDIEECAESCSAVNDAYASGGADVCRYFAYDGGYCRTYSDAIESAPYDGVRFPEVFVACEP